MIKIIAVGYLKEDYLKEAVTEYLKRIKRYNQIEIIEIKDESKYEKDKILKKEATEIIKKINQKDYIITLEIEGKQFTSIEFAKNIDKVFNETNNITFIIGGSYGLAEEIKEMSNLHMSLSKMTLPHQLFRVVLLEQIYRAFKIINNENYHK